MVAEGVVLPGGVRRDGSRHQRASLRPLTGADEEFLVDVAGALLPAERTTAILARCASGEAFAEDAPLAAARALTVGDREALLLHLRRITFGERITCVLRCPIGDERRLDDAACGELVEIDLRVATLLVAPYAEAPGPREIEIERDGEFLVVRIRPPTGADEEAVAPYARRDPALGARLLLERVVETVGRDDGEVVPPADWPQSLTERVDEILPELDPQAEIRLATRCPSCGGEFHVLLDAGSFLHEEVVARARHLHHEVHTLALHYHWSEREILDLTPRKRRIYLDLLAERSGLGSVGA